MPVVACSSCQARLKVPENMAGRKAKCPSCQAVFNVPTEENSAFTLSSPPPPPPPPARAPRPAPLLEEIDEEPPARSRSGRTMKEVLNELDEPRPRQRADAEEEAPRRRYEDDYDEEPRRRRDDAFDDEELPRKRRRKKKEESNMGLILAIVGGVGGLIVLVVVIIVLVQYLGNETGIRTFSLNKGSATSWYIRFKANHRVELTVTSDKNSDVDLFVYDAGGRRILADEGDSKDCYLSFVPPSTQSYKVEVQNRIRLEPQLQWRNTANSGTLKFKETPVQAGANNPLPVNPAPINPVPPLGAGNVIPLPGPGAYPGQITAQDLDPRFPGRFAKVYTYRMNAGQAYTIDMESGFDTYLRLESNAGVILAENDDAHEGTLNSRIVFTPTQTDTYRIVATSLGGVRMGPYTLRVQP